MELPDSPKAKPAPWTSLWAVALLSLLAQLGLCHFFSFGQLVPASIDINPSNLWKFGYHFPPTGSFQVLNWLGVAYPPMPLNPLDLAAAHFSVWLFFTAYAPILATCALLAMAAFLRELELSRPAALFGAVIYAWQGDILPFVYPGHFGYITAWPFFALAGWGALRATRTLFWPYAVFSGACCGIMVGLLTNADRGGIACLLIGALYLAAAFRFDRERATHLGHLVLCVAVAAVIALAPLLALYKNNIAGVKLAGSTNREETYKLVTQYSLGPAETLTYLVPGFFGWHIHNFEGPYWGWIGEWPDWPKNHQGSRNLNLGISTTGTVATALALLAVCLLLPGELLGPIRLPERQLFYGRLLLVLGFVALVLSWGWHTGFYRPLFALPLMDKWRNPLKWVQITNFALVVLGSIGVQHLVASLNAALPEIKIIRRRLLGFIIAITVLLAAGLIASYPLAVVISPVLQNEGYEPPSVANIMSTMHTSMLVALVIMVVLGIVLNALWNPERLRAVTLVNPMLQRFWTSSLRAENLPSTLALTLALLAALQLGWVASQFIDPMPLEELTDSNPLLDTLRHEGNTVRVSITTDDPFLNNLLQNQFAAMGISCLDISAASRIPDDLNAFFKNFSEARARLLLLAGVKNIAGPEELVSQLQGDTALSANIKKADGYTLFPTGSPDLPSHTLVEMKDYLAKATFVPKAEYFKTDEEVLKRLKDPAWNPRESVLFNPGRERADEPLAGKENVSSEEVDLEAYTPTEIRVKARSTLGGFVLINDQFDPDWTVTVNGQKAELLRANYILRAVRVQSGESTVEMHYATHYQLGSLNLPAVVVNSISDGAMLAAFIVAGVAIRRRRSESIAESPVTPA